MQGRSRGILALLTPTVDARATSSSFRATTLATTFGRFGPSGTRVNISDSFKSNRHVENKRHTNAHHPLTSPSPIGATIPPLRQKLKWLKIRTFFSTVFRVTHSWNFPRQLLLLCRISLIAKYVRKKDFRILHLGVRSRPSPHSQNRNGEETMSLSRANCRVSFRIVR